MVFRRISKKPEERNVMNFLWDDFLEDIKNIMVFDVEIEEYGDYGCSFYGSQRFVGDIQEVMNRHPEATQRQLRLGSMILLKRHMAEERKKWYAKQYTKPSMSNWLLELLFRLGYRK